MMNKDYYKILGVEKDADGKTIKKAYRKLAMKYHPDRNAGDKESESKFKEASEAYEVLIDTSKRTQYDNFGSVDGFRHPSPFSWSSPFRRSKRRGTDVQVIVEISFEESIKGCQKEVQIEKQIECVDCSATGALSQETCSVCNGNGIEIVQSGAFLLQMTCRKCRGQGKIILEECKVCNGSGYSSKEKEVISVEIPQGVCDKNILKMRGKGENGGDLYVIVTVQPHDMFWRNGTNIFVEAPVSYTQLVFGGEVVIPYLDGSEIFVKIPQGSQPGDKLKVRGKGTTLLGFANVGDLIVIVYLEVPKKINKKHRTILEQLQNYEKDNLTPNQKSFQVTK